MAMGRKATTSKHGHSAKSNRRWVSDVKTVSTFPPRETFNQDAETVAKTMASKKVSPKGIGSGIRMIQYFINRAGKNLPASQRRELKKQNGSSKHACIAKGRKLMTDESRGRD
jgi:hypothetical protein